jgi:PAS domain S-box-containing protein
MSLMTDSQALYFFVALLAGLILLRLAYSGWQRRHVTGAKAFVGMVLSVALWSLTYTLELTASSADFIMIANRAKYIGITLVPVMWFIFAAQYSGRHRTFVRWQIAALLLIPALTLLLTFTNDTHQLMFLNERISDAGGFPMLEHDFGDWYVVHVAYSYGLILTGAYWMIAAAQRSLTAYEHQTRWILLAVLIPLIGNVLTLTDRNPLPGIDLAPLLFTISGLIFVRLLQARGNLETTPISYEAVIDNLPNAVLVIDAQNRVLAANPPLLRFLQKDESDVIGQPAADLTDDSAAFMERFGNQQEAREEIQVAGRYIDLMLSPLHNAAGDLLARILVFQDVTVRKQTETALMANERRYRALFENSNDAIFIIDLDHTVIIANRQAADMLQVDLARLLHSDALDYIYSAERSDSADRFSQLLEGDPVPLYERTFVRSDGQQVPAEVSLTLVRDVHGEPLHIQMIVRDITARKRAQQAMTARLEQLAVLRQVDEEVNRTLDIDTVLSVALRAAVRLSKADAGFIALRGNDDIIRISQVTGAYSDAIVGEDIRRDVGIVGRVLESRQAELVTDVEADMQYIEDLPDTRALMALPLVSQGRLIGVINLETRHPERFAGGIFPFIQLLAGRLAVAVDNARLYEYVRQQLEELQAIYDELREAERLKTDMIQIANHDLQNPLSIIDGFLHMLEEDRAQFSDEHREFFQLMRNATDRMQQILQDFLSLESINARLESTQHVVDLQPLLKRAFGEYRHQAEAKELDFVLDSDPSQPVTVLADAPQLYEAMTNLINNAIKYTPEGGTVRVDLQATDETVTFAVHDTGYGIPENRQNRLFEPFYRTKTDETATIEGTGLGLHLVKNIVERHHGEIVFSSTYGQGSTFGFRLPPAPPADTGSPSLNGASGTEPQPPLT